MKKIFLLGLVFSMQIVNCGIGSSCPDPRYCLPVSKEMIQEYKSLGMNIYDEDFLNQELDESILTEYWKSKKTLPQEEKNKLLAQIVNLTYLFKDWKYRRLQIASVVLIGANPDIGEHYPEKDDGDTAIQHAGSARDIQLAQLLLKNGANPNKFGGLPPLLCAALYKNSILAKLLLSHGADIDKITLTLPSEYEWVKKIQSECLQKNNDS